MHTIGARRLPSHRKKVGFCEAFCARRNPLKVRCSRRRSGAFNGNGIVQEESFMKERSNRTKWLVPGTVCFALFMINLDGNVVNLAMPTIIRQYRATLSQLEWISNAYMLTFAVFLITLGRLGDQVGRKKMF